MALTITDLWTRLTKSELKDSLLTIAQGVGLPVTAWVLGEPSERWLEIIPRVLDQVLGTVIVEAVKAFFLDQATDPGDPGNASTEIKPGWLSGLGEGWYGVRRRGQTYATGTLTLTNNNAFAISIKPGDIQVESTVAASDGGHPTYTTSEDASIYVNADGSVTVAAGGSIDLPIRADIIGTYSNAGSGDVTQVNTGSFGTLACTNAAGLLGAEREAAEDYRARCRRASARVATGAPSATYEYAANTAADGTPLQRHDGSGPVGITKVFVDDALTEAGSVTVYVGDPDGDVDAIDVASADANITGIPLGVITNPIAVVPGSVDYTTVEATQTTLHVQGTASIKAADAGGLTALELQTKITEALAAYVGPFPIGGIDQVAGAGVIYMSDLGGVARDAWPGLYGVVIVAPAFPSVALTLGHEAVLDSNPTTDWTVTIS
jgi:hypothetical protein